MHRYNFKFILIALGVITTVGFGVYLFLYYQYSLLTINVNYNDSAIYLDGVAVGTGSAEIKTKKGEHVITITHPVHQGQERKIILAGGQEKEENFVLLLKQYSNDDFKELSKAEQKTYEGLSDAKADNDEGILRERFPIVKSLPYIDDINNFRIDYGGDIYSPILYLTIYGRTEDLDATKKKATKWLRDRADNFDELKIEYRNRTYSGPGTEE